MRWEKIGILALGLMISEASLARGITFSAVELPELPPIDMSSPERGALDKVLDLHNLMLDINRLSGLDRQKEFAVKFKKAEIKKMNAYEQCALKKLQKRSQNPQKEWDDLKNAYDQGKANPEMEAYGERKQALQGTEEFEQEIDGKASQTVARLKGKIATYMPLTPADDLTRATARQNVIGKLKVKYEELIKEAEAELNKRQPETDEYYAKDKTLLEALKKDSEGKVFLNENNADRFDELKEQNQVLEKLETGMDKIDKLLDQEIKLTGRCPEGDE